MKEDQVGNKKKKEKQLGKRQVPWPAPWPWTWQRPWHWPTISSIWGRWARIPKQMQQHTQ